MAPGPLTIEPLHAAGDLPAALAARQFAAWGRSTGYDTEAGYAGFLTAAATTAPDALPAVLVARRAGAVVGSVNLLVSEMTIRPALSPWLAQLFVFEASRRQGVGAALIDAACARAAALGFRRLHLYTSGTLPTWYAGRGWRPIEAGVDYLSKSRTIMAIDLSPPAESSP